MTDTINKAKTCCFTGHRAIPADKLSSVTNHIENAIVSLIDSGYNTFLSGGAVGFDLLAANTVLRMKNNYPGICLLMILPCNDQDSKWNPGQKKLYRNTLSSADKIIVLNEHYCTGCMHQRNRFMVDNSSLCIAYLTRSSGGTAYTVSYAEEKNCRIINVAHFIR